MSPSTVVRLARDQAQVLVVDIQQKLLPLIHDHDAVLRAAETMIRAAQMLAVPVTLTEQYPQGLGPTHPKILAAVGKHPPLQKMTFSVCGDQACLTKLNELNRPQVLVVGIEAHVCVLQTALDLLRFGMQPVVLADAVSSRREFDRAVAFDRLRMAGVIVTTVESAIFELLHESGTDLFKKLLALVK